MAWDGWFRIDSNELINVSRTEVLAAHKPWFKAVVENPYLAETVGEEAVDYADITTAPWWDPDEPGAAKFYGLYPISVTGLEDSSRTSATVESTEDGGVPGRVRHAMKSAVFNLLIIAEDTQGAEYGMRWLREALLGSVCDPLTAPDSVLGHTVTYLASEPVWMADGVSAQYPVIGRTARRVVFNAGPSLLNDADNLSCGGSVWNVQFSCVIGVPYVFGLDKPILLGYLDPDVTDPWAPGVENGLTSAYVYAEEECGDNLWQPIYDPLCPALIVPPAPPSVPLGCFVPEDNWQRYMVTIPASTVPLFGEMVPLIELSTTAEQRNVRLRFYADPDGEFDPEDTPCDFIGDVVVSYIPASGSLILDGATKEVFVITSANRRRRADSLVFRTDGKPFQWPALTCGYGYVMTVDTPLVTDPPVIDLSFTYRAV